MADPGSPGSRGETEAPEPWPRPMPPAWHTGSLSRQARPGHSSRRWTRAPRTKRNRTFGRGKAVLPGTALGAQQKARFTGREKLPPGDPLLEGQGCAPRPQSSSHTRRRGPCASTLDGPSWQGLPCLHCPPPPLHREKAEAQRGAATCLWAHSKGARSPPPPGAPCPGWPRAGPPPALSVTSKSKGFERVGWWAGVSVYFVNLDDDALVCLFA